MFTVTPASIVKVAPFLMAVGPVRVYGLPAGVQVVSVDIRLATFVPWASLMNSKPLIRTVVINAKQIILGLVSITLSGLYSEIKFTRFSPD